jgi:hypothetical protein
MFMSGKKEYIERVALIDIFNCKSDMATGTPKAVFANAAKMVELMPAADVVEVRHGYWIPSPDGINPIRCSECNMPAPFAAVENEFGDFEICRYPSSYCHECGAKMDGRKEQT